MWAILAQWNKKPKKLLHLNIKCCEVKLINMIFPASLNIL